MPAKQEQMTIRREGNDWIFSFADLMTLLLCFFIIFFNVNTGEEDRVSDVKNEIKKAFKASDDDSQVSSGETYKALHLIVSALNITRDIPTLVGEINKLRERSDTEDRAREVIQEFLRQNGQNLQEKSSVLNSLSQPKIEFVIPYKNFIAGTVKLKRKHNPQIKKIAESLSGAETVDRLIIKAIVPEESSLASNADDSIFFALNRAKHIAQLLRKDGVDGSKIEFQATRRYWHRLDPNQDKSRIKIVVKFKRNNH